MTKIPNIRTNIPFDLPARGSWPASRHVFDEESADAIRMALAAERPLLVRGEPGTGKSQLARAAAEELRRLFVAEVVHSRTEPQDLQWRFDAIAGQSHQIFHEINNINELQGKRGVLL